MALIESNKKFSMLRRQFLASGLVFCLPVLAREEFATLHFVPALSPEQPKQGVSKNKKGPERSKSVRCVMIDPGHGGKDPGAIGHTGSEEKHVVLEIAQNIRELLSHRKDIVVKLTREEDHFIPLYERVNIAHKHDADIFLSIHADGFLHPEARGASVFALSTRGASSTMARYMAKRENSADDFTELDAMAIIPADVPTHLLHKTVECHTRPVPAIVHLVFQPPENPSHAALSGEHPLRDIERVSPEADIRCNQPGHR